jgi:hypothetical protein
MSANGELFIDGYLRETAMEVGLFDNEEEHIITPSAYYDIWSDKDIELEGEVEIDDALEGKGNSLKWRGVLVADEDGTTFELVSLERGGVVIQILNDYTRAKGDWIHQLQPIIVDLLDGEPKLVKADVEWLMPILQAKIEFYHGLITREEYETILNNTER